MDKFQDILDIGAAFEVAIEWLIEEADWFFDFIAMIVEGFLDGVNWLFSVSSGDYSHHTADPHRLESFRPESGCFYSHRIYPDSVYGILD